MEDLVERIFKRFQSYCFTQKEIISPFCTLVSSSGVLSRGSSTGELLAEGCVFILPKF